MSEAQQEAVETDERKRKYNSFAVGYTTFGGWFLRHLGAISYHCSLCHLPWPQAKDMTTHGVHVFPPRLFAAHVVSPCRHTRTLREA